MGAFLGLIAVGTEMCWAHIFCSCFLGFELSSMNRAVIVVLGMSLLALSTVPMIVVVRILPLDHWLEPWSIIQVITIQKDILDQPRAVCFVLFRHVWSAITILFASVNFTQNLTRFPL